MRSAARHHLLGRGGGGRHVAAAMAGWIPTAGRCSAVRPLCFGVGATQNIGRARCGSAHSPAAAKLHWFACTLLLQSRPLMQPAAATPWPAEETPHIDLNPSEFMSVGLRPQDDRFAQQATNLRVYLTRKRRAVLDTMRAKICTGNSGQLQMNFAGIGGVGKSHVLLLFAHLLRKQADSSYCVVYVHNSQLLVSDEGMACIWMLCLLKEAVDALPGGSAKTEAQNVLAKSHDTTTLDELCKVYRGVRAIEGLTLVLLLDQDNRVMRLEKITSFFETAFAYANRLPSHATICCASANNEWRTRAWPTLATLEPEPELSTANVEEILGAAAVAKIERNERETKAVDEKHSKESVIARIAQVTQCVPLQLRWVSEIIVNQSSLSFDVDAALRAFRQRLLTNVSESLQSHPDKLKEWANVAATIKFVGSSPPHVEYDKQWMYEGAESGAVVFLNEAVCSAYIQCLSERAGVLQTENPAVPSFGLYFESKWKQRISQGARVCSVFNVEGEVNCTSDTVDFSNNEALKKAVSTAVRASKQAATESKKTRDLPPQYWLWPMNKSQPYVDAIAVVDGNLLFCNFCHHKHSDSLASLEKDPVRGVAYSLHELWKTSGASAKFVWISGDSKNQATDFVSMGITGRDHSSNSFTKSVLTKHRLPGGHIFNFHRTFVNDRRGAKELLVVSPLSALEAPEPSWTVCEHGGTGSAFPVEPKKPTVMHLKKAIKAEKSPELDHIAADALVIRRADSGGTEALDAEAALEVGVKYTYEAPAPHAADPTALRSSLPRQAEWIVCAHGGDSGSAFPVKPEQPTVMHLKKAIKLEAEVAGPAHLLVIRKAGGEEELDAEAALEPGVKYSYEVPK
jgi:hypothetical protein